jgi:molybdate transport system substrate-binding protein
MAMLTRRRGGRRTGCLALALALSGALGATAAAAPASTRPSAALSGTITVSAASSLTESFTQLGTDFEHLHRGVTVRVNFNASSTLAAQIEEGAPADVFASADQANVDRVAREGLISGRPLVFAQNLLEIAVAPGNPKRIRSLADTVRPGVTLVLCAAGVPCGTFARQAYARQHLNVSSVPTGLNVRDTLSKVTLGEADAAVVYVTDVKAAKGAVVGVPIPLAQNVRAVYPIAVVKASSELGVARAFVRYVLSRAGQATMRRFGFLAP